MMPDWLSAFLIALFVGTLVEYWGHRAMHTFLMRSKHAVHHKDGFGQGWLWEFFDYFWGTTFVLWIGFLYSVEAGIGFAAGGTFYAAMAAYSHQLQHEMPELCFWMPQPSHRTHHEQHMWHHNFGISLDFWDRVFGTYKKVDWKPENKYPLRKYFLIKWF